MTPRTRFRSTSLLLCVLLAVGVFWGVTVSAQQANLNEAIKAVVRIRGCNSAGCNVDLGSGVIIDPSGVILTANHVTLTDPKNSLSPHLEDFVIEVTEDARKAPQARYRANLIAAKPESDLALLHIYQDEATNQPLDDPTSVHLPALALADVNAIGVGDRLHVLGYPLAGGASINYADPALGGFDENGTLLKVNASLNEGYSGGPALVEHDGHYEIAGVIIRRRGDVSLIRSIDQLHSLTWEPTARRVWLDHVQVTAQGNAADATVKVSADIHALDYANRDGRLLAYVFDANTRQPWPAGASGLDRSANGQLVLRQAFSVTHMVDVLAQQTLTLSLKQLNTQSDRLVFRLLLWDMNETHVLWRDDQWRRPDQGTSEIALAPTQTSTFTPLPTTIPTPSTIAIPTVTSVPTPTATETPLPTNTPTPSATNTVPPTNIPIVAVPIAISTTDPTIEVDAMATIKAAPTQTPPIPILSATDTPLPITPNAVATAVALHLDPADVRINPVDDAVYVRVPSGEFIRGADNGNSDEKPVHRVDVDEFWIMQTEVTNAQYKKCVEATICAKPNNDSWDKPEQANYPVTDVEWQQASTYAQWVGGRLPTEAEWEKAACGTDGRTYPWGNDEPTKQLLNYNYEVGHTTKVGTYPKGVSPYGALDMAGNAWEWTADWFAAYYATASLQNPQGPTTGNLRVVRGGSWYDLRDLVRCAYRRSFDPDGRYGALSFRVVTPGS